MLRPKRTARPIVCRESGFYYSGLIHSGRSFGKKLAKRENVHCKNNRTAPYREIQLLGDRFPYISLDAWRFNLRKQSFTYVDFEIFFVKFYVRDDIQSKAYSAKFDLVGLISFSIYQTVYHKTNHIALYRLILVLKGRKWQHYGFDIHRQYCNWVSMLSMMTSCYVWLV